MKFVFGGIAFLVLLLVVAGCTQSSTTTTVATTVPTAEETTEIPTTVETTAAAVATTMETPGPTQTLQSTWAVDVQVQSNGKSIDPQIVATFRGGKGMNVIPKIEVIVTHEDGTVVSDSFTQPLYIGKTVSLQSTTGNKNRAEVWITTPQGDRVKTYDAYVPFRSYN